jgi:NAD(P)-dependent dehydrogenase (short-subunit alcohol dehydrogenase family)
MMPTVSVVTGAAGGMGAACARRLASRGPVVISDRNVAALDVLAAELRAIGSEVHVGLTDVADRDAVRALARTAADVGPVGAVAHTAGVSPTMDDPATILTVDLLGTAYLLDAFLEYATQQTAAVCVASQSAYMIPAFDPGLGPMPDCLLQPGVVDRLRSSAPDLLADPGIAYGWAKRQVVDLVVAYAPAWGARGARVVSLSPGIIDTGMGRQELDAQPFMQTIIEKTPLGRIGTPDEIASVVEFLTSDAASFVTGVDLLVDGGSTHAVGSALA